MDSFESIVINQCQDKFQPFKDSTSESYISEIWKAYTRTNFETPSSMEAMHKLSKYHILQSVQSTFQEFDLPEIKLESSSVEIK
jgi:hypothetical protein